MERDHLEDTARIDRRHSVLAQIEAALLAGRLEVSEAPARTAGTNPYDSAGSGKAAPRQDKWGNGRR